MEMGGKNPLIVLDDADLDTAVNCAVQGAFYSTGQRCTASSRLIVTEGIHDRFVGAMEEALKALNVDDARKAGTQIGPVVDQSQLDQDLSYVDIGVKEGAKLDEAGKRRLADVNQRLAALAAEFGQNVLADEAGWSLPLAEGDVEGLPESLTGAMEEAARKALDGEAGQTAIIAEHAKGYAALLRGHIEKENDILYPLAERILPEDVRSDMLAAYDAAGAKTPGLEERYLQMVEAYEQQAGTL